LDWLIEKKQKRETSMIRNFLSIDYNVRID
jgi:hypothetical protein